MKNIIVGNPYNFFKSGDVICVTTNGEIRKDGKAVMGAGNAKFARDTFKGIDSVLAELLKKYGNKVFILGRYILNGKELYIVSFPTKNKWQDSSNLNLIEESAKGLKSLIEYYKFQTVYLPAPGCSNGQLKWSEVKDKLKEIENEVIVYSLDKQTFKN